MTALLLERRTGLGQCCEPGCSRVSRYSICIAGYYLMKDGLLGGKVGICSRCGKEQVRIWNELTGRTNEEEQLAAVHKLAGSPADRADAVDSLRALGFPAESVAKAIKGWKDGLGAEEILSVLGEVEMAGAVAA